MIRLLAMSMRVFVSAFRSHCDLLLENLAGRQQFACVSPLSDRAIELTARGRCRWRPEGGNQ